MKKTTETRRKGRTGSYTPERAEIVCTVIMEGGSVAQAAEKAGIKKSIVFDWIRTREDFAERYRSAVEIRTFIMEDKFLDLFQKAHEAALDPECGRERVQAIRVELDTLKWILSKMLPKKYGDRSAVEMTGAEGKPLVPEPVPQGQLAELAVMLAEARAKIEQGGGAAC